MKKIITWSSEHISFITKALDEGNIVVGTSDTVFGLLAKTDQRGFDVLNAIKGRSEKPYLVITGSMQKAAELCEHPKEELLACMTACWPGPVTMIVKAKSSVPSYMTSKEGNIAIRVPNHEGFKLLLKEIPYLFSTSANLAGKPVPHHKEDLDQSILDRCSYVVLDAQEQIKDNKPSTLIDCTQLPFKIIREGAVTFDELKKKCNECF